jgi:hypothetical protein
MLSEIANHRKGAYIYGLLSGVGVTMLTWGVTWVVWSPTRNLTAFLTLTLLGVSLLAFGGCREAYLRGSLSVLSTSATDTNHEPAIVPSTQESILCEPEQQNQV